MDTEENIELLKEIRQLDEQEENLRYAGRILNELEEEEQENLKNSFYLQADLAARYGGDVKVSSLLDENRWLLKKSEVAKEEIFQDTKSFIREKIEAGEEQKQSYREALEKAD